MKLSLILCTLNRAESLKRLLHSISEQDRLPDQVIIVDASDNSETEEMIKQCGHLADRIEYYHTERGLTRQRNYGLTKANGDIIGFFDDDVVLDTDYISQIISVFENDTEEGIGGATGYIYVRKGQKMSLANNIFDRMRRMISGPKCVAFHYGITLIPSEPFEDIWYVRYVSGCNMFFRQEVFKKIKFDTWFEGYGLGEDRDFGLRVSKQWKIAAVGKARLEHLHINIARPNYQKLGKMVIENPARVLTVAREKHLYINGTILIFRQFLGILFESSLFALRGKFSCACEYILGGLQGIPAAFKHLLKVQNK